MDKEAKKLNDSPSKASILIDEENLVFFRKEKNSKRLKARVEASVRLVNKIIISTVFFFMVAYFSVLVSIGLMEHDMREPGVGGIQIEKNAVQNAVSPTTKVLDQQTAQTLQQRTAEVLKEKGLKEVPKEGLEVSPGVVVLP